MKTAIDLFAGAGGLSYGFEQAGFEILFANEIDEWAAETYIYNREKPNIVIDNISNINDSVFHQFVGITDVVMGGPPCQGFSIAASNRRNINDDRNYLFRQFLRVVRLTMPKVVLLENVRQFNTFVLPDGTRIIDEIYNSLIEMGYIVEHAIINISKYGVPQDRIRFFLIAHSKNDFWLPSFFDNLPQTKEISIWEAISDLPTVYPFQYQENALIEYDKPANNDYQRSLRNSNGHIANHISMRHTKRTIERFSHISFEENADLPNAFKPRRRGNPEEISEIIYDQNHRRIFPNKPSPTITASFYSSFIHPYADRNLTVREAARIQGFPDDYIFMGKRTTLSKKLLKSKGIEEDMHLDQFNQVGNAVPPIFAELLARAIISRLGG